MFRNLNANEIEIRVQSVKQSKHNTGAILLLYKNSRCDMQLLDETVGMYNWKREHTRENHNCIVSLWDKDKEEWIPKEDTGTESNTEAQKGLASDSFKRACFNWGIGRELYTAPFTWVNLDKSEYYDTQGKKRLNNWVKFHVSEIVTSNEKVIERLVIKDQTGKIRFSTESKHDKTPKGETPVEKFEEHSTITDEQKESLDKMRKYYTENNNTKGLKYLEDIKTFESAKKAIEAFSIKMAEKVLGKEYEKDEIASGQQAQQMDIF